MVDMLSALGITQKVLDIIDPIIQWGKRKMLKWLFPCEFKVDRAIPYYEWNLGEPGVKWYVAYLDVMIIPVIKTNIGDYLFALLTVSGSDQRCDLSERGKWGVSWGKGYPLDAGREIGPKEFEFRFLLRNGESLSERATINLIIGSRKHSRKVTLKEVPPK